jgi:hypothetical protein
LTKKEVIAIGLKSFNQRTIVVLYSHSAPCIGKKPITTPCKPPKIKIKIGREIHIFQDFQVIKFPWAKLVIKDDA